MARFERVAYITTAATVPSTEAFCTLTLVKPTVSGSGTTATKIGGGSFINGGIVQFRNDSTARLYTAKLYVSMVESPGAITNGDWIELDSVSVAAQVGDVLGTAKIQWSYPYKWLAIGLSAAAETTGAALVEMYGHR